MDSASVYRFDAQRIPSLRRHIHLGPNPNNSMAVKISFLNLKGGVGKTSLLVNVASCLAYMGKRVLVVDFDYQSNSSIWLMRLDRWNTLNRNQNNFVLSVFKEGGSGLKQCVQKDIVRNADDEKVLKGLDLIPASFSLMDLEHEVPNPWGKPFYAHFKEELNEIEDQYDYIFFDCPPSFFTTSQCALFSSEHIVVPANPDALSIIGFHLLIDKLESFKKQSYRWRQELSVAEPQVLGISLNAIKPGTNIDVPVERFNAQIERFAGQGKIPESTSIFPEQIRYSVSVGRAVMQGLPMVLMSKREASITVAEDYIKTTQRIVSLTAKEAVAGVN
jgi:chromosome partitioning protein